MDRDSGQAVGVQRQLVTAAGRCLRRLHARQEPDTGALSSGFTSKGFLSLAVHRPLTPSPLALAGAGFWLEGGLVLLVKSLS